VYKSDYRKLRTEESRYTLALTLPKPPA
jgi:hypothetical protein